MISKMAISPESSEAKEIQLLKDEEGGLLYEEGIATISFYKGPFKPTVEAIRAQLALVVASNPWVAGRLVTTGAGMRLKHPSSPSAADVDALFTATSAEDSSGFKIKANASYVDMCTEMYNSGKVIIGGGNTLVDQDVGLTKLVLSEKSAGEFALIFSMTHTVADGRTYYEIFQMLTPGAAVRALNVTRVLTFSEEVCSYLSTYLMIL